MKKTAIIIVGLAVLIGAGIILFGGQGGSANGKANVTIVDGEQGIEIDVKGGYSPRVTEAQAGIPTIIKMRTSGTFACSASVVIPDLKSRKLLPSNGETIVELPPQEPGFVLRGLCSMGMYNFEIRFS